MVPPVPNNGFTHVQIDRADRARSLSNHVILLSTAAVMA